MPSPTETYKNLLAQVQNQAHAHTKAQTQTASNETQPWFDALERARSTLGGAVPPDHLPKVVLEAVQKQLYLEHRLNGTQLDPALSLLAVLTLEFQRSYAALERGAIPTDLPLPFTEAQPWVDALADLLTAFPDCPPPLRGSALIAPRWEWAALADALAHFAQAGIALPTQDGVVVLEEQEIEPLLECLRGPITALGGRATLERLLRDLRGRWDPALERYRLYPTPIPLQTAQFRVIPMTAPFDEPAALERTIPWALLLELCVQAMLAAPDEAPPQGWDETLYQNLLIEGQHLVSLYEVEVLNPNVSLVLRPAVAFDWVYDQAAFGGMVAFPQWSLKDQSTLLRTLFATLDAQAFEAHTGHTLEQAHTFLEALLKVPQAQLPLELDPARPVIGDIPFPPAVWTALLNTFTVEPAELRGARVIPLAGEVSRDSLTRPLIPLGNGALYADHAWRSSTGYEALAEVARAIVPGRQAHPRIGTCFEDWARQRAQGLGVTLHRGFPQEAPDLESDLVLETDGIVVFVEMKAKTLTRQAQQGEGGKLLLDLAHSFLYAQTQATRLHLALLEQGTLRFHPDAKTAQQGQAKPKGTLTQQGKQVYRVSLSLVPFGRLQHPQRIQAFLQAAAWGRFFISTHAQTDQRTEWLKQVNDVVLTPRPQAAGQPQSGLQAAYQDLIVHPQYIGSGWTESDYFRNTLFLSHVEWARLMQTLVTLPSERRSEWLEVKLATLVGVSWPTEMLEWLRS